MLPRVLGACCLIGLQLTLTTARAGASFCDDDEAGGFRTVFRDEFDGAKLDESKWNVEVAAAPGGGRLHIGPDVRQPAAERSGLDCARDPGMQQNPPSPGCESVSAMFKPISPL